MHRKQIIALTTVLLLALAVWMGRAVVFAQGPDDPRPTPTVVPDAPVHSAGASAELPDLVIDEIRVNPQNPYVNRDFRIDVVIANQGAGNVPDNNNFFVDLYIDPPSRPEPGVKVDDPDHTWGVQYFWVPAGGQYTLSFTTQFTNTGGHQVYAVIDPDGHVQERNEENNSGGPESFNVRTRGRWTQSRHEDFQKGFSNLDLSHPRGLIQIGEYTKIEDARVGVTQQFDEPEFDPNLYFPDSRVNPPTYTNPVSPSQIVEDTSLQIKPFVTKGPGDEAGVVWEDYRRSGTDSDVYFARSPNNGLSWNAPMRVSGDDPALGARQRDPVLIYNSECNRYHAFWGDDRLGSFDIFHAFLEDGETSWEEWPRTTGGDPKPVNTPEDDPDAPQTHPTVAVDENGNLFLAWQDRRKGNYDIFFAYSTDCGQTWSDNAFVTDQPAITDQNQRAPAIAVISGDTYTDTRVLIAWQDARRDSGDIFVVAGHASPPPLNPFTFDIDVRVNDDDAGALQRDPAVDGIESTVVTKYTVNEQIGDTTITHICEAVWGTNVVHVVWEDYRNNNADVFYSWFFLDVVFLDYQVASDRDQCDTRLDDNRPDSPDERVNFNVGTVSQRPIDLGENEPESASACWGPNSEDVYPMENTFQGEPTVAVYDECRTYVAWSDGRSFDDLNRDIHLMVFERDNLESQNFLDFNAISMVNNNVKRLGLLIDTELDAYSEFYDEYAPAGASQRRPTLFVERPPDTACVLRSGEELEEGELAELEQLEFLATWDDDRHTDPFGGTITNRDIFFARRHDEPRGTYISPVFDAGPNATWYDIQWWAATQQDSSLHFQVRLGDTPTPPIDNKAENGWTEWSGPGGVGGKYDAPGQNIRDSDGSRFPTHRYAQYRILINQDRPPELEDNPRGACVSEVTLNYEPELEDVYLPIAFGGGAGSPTTGSRPNDEYYKGSTPLQWNLDLIDVESAWEQARGDNVTIAIVDTGVDRDHPDLQSKLLPGYDFVNDDNDPDDNDGDYPSVAEIWGHGTHVAGIAAATTNNSVGVAGVGWNTRILPIKSLDETGTGTVADIAAGIRYAADQGADIINLSLGGEHANTVKVAVDYAIASGALVIAATGNKGIDIYPAAYDGVLSVAAVLSDRTIAPYSNGGSFVDVAAPGGEDGRTRVDQLVWSTYPIDKLSGTPEVGYDGLHGTSMAAPHVSGLAALVWSKNSGLNATQVADLITSTALDLGASGRDDDFGHGLIRAGAAVDAAAATTVRATASDEQPHVLAVEPTTLNVIGEYQPGRLIVALQPEVSMQSAAGSLEAHGATLDKELFDDIWLTSVSDGRELEVLDALEAEPAVLFVEPNYYYYIQ